MTSKLQSRHDTDVSTDLPGTGRGSLAMRGAYLENHGSRACSKWPSFRNRTPKFATSTSAE